VREKNFFLGEAGPHRDPDNFKLKNNNYMTRKQEIALEVDQLKQQLRERERERAIVKWLILAVNTYSLGSDNCSYYES